MGGRSLSIHSVDDLTKGPLAEVNMDNSPATLIPHYDEDSATVFLAGRVSVMNQYFWRHNTVSVTLAYWFPGRRVDVFVRDKFRRALPHPARHVQIGPGVPRVQLPLQIEVRPPGGRICEGLAVKQDILGTDLVQSSQGQGTLVSYLLSSQLKSVIRILADTFWQFLKIFSVP